MMIEFTDITVSQHSKQITSGYAYGPGFRVRYHGDSSYKSQAYVALDCWRDGWQEICRLDGHTFDFPNGYAQTTTKETHKAAMDDAFDLLAGIAVRVLGHNWNRKEA